MIESIARWRARADAPVDIASLVALRVLVGLLIFGSVCRFAWNGWIRIQFVEPAFAFKYFGFGWVPVTPSPWIYAEFALLGLLALAVAAGFRYRTSIALLVIVFVHVQLMDATNYLNHYYFVALLLLVLATLPLGRAGSIDTWADPSRRLAVVPAWMVWLVRFQVGLVYCGAALAKVGEDWLLHGQPLGLWLRSRQEMPVFGAFFDEPWLPLALSWAGFLFDATIVLFLLNRRTRLAAYAVILCFHAMTFALFDIGIFPFVMPIATLAFFEPSWPRRWLRLPAPAPLSVNVSRSPRWLQRAAVAWCILHMLVPLRHLAYPGNVLWEEEGMRFSWRVMVREKSGAVAYFLRDPASGREWQVNPARYLTWRQLREMSTQPDLILQLAHHIADEERARLGHAVEIRAEALVSLNGRPAAPLIDSSVDLATIAEGLMPARWVLPRPVGDPAAPGLTLARAAAHP